MGSRSSGREIQGVKRTYVRLAGFQVSGEICIPRVHPHALWLLPCVERLLQGTSMAELVTAPPWPVPRDGAIVRQLVRELIDLGWAVPRWSGEGVDIDPRLEAQFAEGGREALARELSVIEVRAAEWWMDGLGGTILSRQRAQEYDWDFHAPADIKLPLRCEPQALLDRAQPALEVLLGKLGGSGLARADRERAFLREPLQAGSPKEIRFPVFGVEPRILPDPLAELEPSLDRYAPHVFGGAAPAVIATPPATRIVRPIARPPTPSPPLPISKRSAGAVAPHPLIKRLMEEMIPIPAGNFRMGDDRVRLEAPRHRVVLTRPFLLANAPVTQGVWKAVMEKLPMLHPDDSHPEFPIIHVGYDETCAFLDRLNALPGGGGFDLPTEAQWEYACRAGSDGVYCFGDNPGAGSKPGTLETYAWTKRSGRRGLQRTKLLKPNKWGLYDMHGLVYETMRDGRRVYGPEEVIDPIGPLDGGHIVARGGWSGRWPVDPRDPEQEHFRCASRQKHEPSKRVSFRLMRHID